MRDDQTQRLPERRALRPHFDRARTNVECLFPQLRQCVEAGVSRKAPQMPRHSSLSGKFGYRRAKRVEDKAASQFQACPKQARRRHTVHGVETTGGNAPRASPGLKSTVAAVFAF